MPRKHIPAPPQSVVDAANNSPVPLGRRSRWAAILPAVHILISRSFSLTEAVDWLISKRAIPAKDRQRAYNSIAQRLHRAGVQSPRKPLSVAQPALDSAIQQSLAKALALV